MTRPRWFNVYTEVTVTEGRVYQVKATSVEDACAQLEAAKFNWACDTFETSDNNDERITGGEEAEGQ